MPVIILCPRCRAKVQIAREEEKQPCPSCQTMLVYRKKQPAEKTAASAPAQQSPARRPSSAAPAVDQDSPRRTPERREPEKYATPRRREQEDDFRHLPSRRRRPSWIVPGLIGGVVVALAVAAVVSWIIFKPGDGNAADKPGDDKSADNTAYSIKFAPESAGTVIAVSETMSLEARAKTIDAAGKGGAENTNKVAVERKWQDALYTARSGTLGLRRERKYIEDQMGSKASPLKGRTYVVEKISDKNYRYYHPDGRLVAGNELNNLVPDIHTGRPFQPGSALERALLPVAAVKVGDKWPVDASETLAWMAYLIVDKDKSAGTCELVKAYKKDGHQFGVLRAVIECPLLKMANMKHLTMLEGSKVVAEYHLDGCIDGSIEDSVLSVKLTVSGTADDSKNPGSRMAVDNRMEYTQTVQRQGTHDDNDPSWPPVDKLAAIQKTPDSLPEKKESKRPGTEDPSDEPAQGFAPPLDPRWDESKMVRVYLSDMLEIDPLVGPSKIGAKGDAPDGTRSAVLGRFPAKGLSLQPASKGFSSVKYRLGRRAKIFHTGLGLQEPNVREDVHFNGTVRFHVLGDGKLLWISAPMRELNVSTSFRINVENVDVLELRIECPGNFGGARALWFDPCVFSSEAAAAKNLSVPKGPPPEGPAPKGWYVLFRSDDPSLWNTKTDKEIHDKYAVPVWTAHSTIRYLRLTRMDTREAIIIPITHKMLAEAPSPDQQRNRQGVDWNGTNELKYRGRHLGVFHWQPSRVRPSAGEICVCSSNDDFSYCGSGFGHKAFADNAQCFSWKGKEIPKTVFEIAVTAEELTDAEKALVFVGAEPKKGGKENFEEPRKDDKKFFDKGKDDDGIFDKDKKRADNSPENPRRDDNLVPFDTNGETPLFGGVAKFKDVAPADGILIGLEVGRGSYGTNDIVDSVRPIYGTPAGDVLGQRCGINEGSVTTVRAKAGYAIGALTVRSGLLPDGLSVTFMRIRDGKLDPKDAYESRWIGGRGGAQTRKVISDGTLIVGVVGVTNDHKHCTGVGLVLHAKGPAPKGPPPSAPEGPAPKGWYVLFRSDDPSLWDTRTGKETADQYAVPLRTAHSTIRYLRLTRMDTREAMIIPMMYEELDVAPAELPQKGFRWNGTKDLYYKGRHLGIFQTPSPGFQRGGICIHSRHSVEYLGSGFGHKSFFDHGQYYSWKGKEIPKTVFEIAVSAEELTDAEKALIIVQAEPKKANNEFPGDKGKLESK